MYQAITRLERLRGVVECLGQTGSEQYDGTLDSLCTLFYSKDCFFDCFLCLRPWEAIAKCAFHLRSKCYIDWWRNPLAASGGCSVSGRWFLTVRRFSGDHKKTFLGQWIPITYIGIEAAYLMHESKEARPCTQTAIRMMWQVRAWSDSCIMISSAQSQIYADNLTRRPS